MAGSRAISPLKGLLRGERGQLRYSYISQNLPAQLCNKQHNLLHTSATSTSYTEQGDSTPALRLLTSTFGPPLWLIAAGHLISAAVSWTDQAAFEW